ncbi:MAG: cation diffusion facilitator family transporter [Lachnospiraceae bacterium]|nr:cation diffusion facilitator family transporter [Lachnospiraceae bacterium]
MVTLLSTLFIKNRKSFTDADVRRKYGILCGALGIFLNVLLFAAKYAAGLFSHSIAVTADAFNNLSDAGSSIITLIGFKMAGQKPDNDHPFGHGRIEYISGLLVAVAIIIMGFELLKSSVEKILQPSELSFSPLIIAILSISILVKCYMAFYNKGIGSKIDSSSMQAVATDSLSDMLATSAVLISTILSHFTGFNADGWCGIIVGLFVCYAGFSAARDTISPLLGQAPDPGFVDRINKIVLSYDKVTGIHDLIVHNYGPGRILISLHAEVPADGDLVELHDMIDLIEHELKNTLNCNAVIHMDPVFPYDEESSALKQQLLTYLHSLDERLSIHDFRLVKGITHTNVIFDISAPFDYKLSDDELTADIKKRLSEENPKYIGVIDIDRQCF